MDGGGYVLVTACRNERAYVDDLVRTVARQTARPMAWAVVDDGSTDGTAEALQGMAARHPFMRVVRRVRGRERTFASKVHAERAGYDALRALDFEFVGFLDADIRLGRDYYARMIDEFAADGAVGLLGGAVVDTYADRVERPRAGSERWHVAGGLQLFRRCAYERIGGYLPLEAGAEDTVAEVMLRMHGWRVQTLSDVEVAHLRPDGVGRRGAFHRGMAWGRRFHAIGYDPLFYVGACVRRMRRPPLVLGGLWEIVGFCVASWRAQPRPVTGEFVEFLRREQRRRLAALVRPGGGAGGPARAALRPRGTPAQRMAARRGGDRRHRRARDDRCPRSS